MWLAVSYENVQSSITMFWHDLRDQNRDKNAHETGKNRNNRGVGDGGGDDDDDDDDADVDRVDDHADVHVQVRLHMHINVSADVSAKTVEPQVMHWSPHHFQLSAEPVGVAGFCKIWIAETLSACALEADLIMAYENLFLLRANSSPSCEPWNCGAIEVPSHQELIKGSRGTGITSANPSCWSKTCYLRNHGDRGDPLPPPARPLCLAMPHLRAAPWRTKTRKVSEPPKWMLKPARGHVFKASLGHFVSP